MFVWMFREIPHHLQQIMGVLTALSQMSCYQMKMQHRQRQCQEKKQYSTVSSTCFFQQSMLGQTWLAIKFLKGLPCESVFGKYNHIHYGGVSLIFPSLSFIFVARHWWQLEKPN